MTENNLIQILPNIYIGDCDNELIQYYNILNIININTSKQNYHDFNTLNVSTDDFDELIHSDKLLNLDFNTINDFIIEVLRKNEQVIICDKNMIVSFTIICAFILKFLNIPFTNTITFVQRKMNLDIKTIPQILLFQLFTYFK